MKAHARDSRRLKENHFLKEEVEREQFNRQTRNKTLSWKELTSESEVEFPKVPWSTSSPSSLEEVSLIYILLFFTLLLFKRGRSLTKPAIVVTAPQRQAL